MPFASKAQQRFLHAHPEKVGGEKALHEWDAATDFKHLPEHKHMSEAGYGGLAHGKPSMAEKKHPAPKHGMKHSHVEHHANGSHTAKHTMHDGSEVSAALKDDDALKQHMEEMLGANAGAAPAAGEAEPVAAGA
jgi:hypothetical protein